MSKLLSVCVMCAAAFALAAPPFDDAKSVAVYDRLPDDIRPAAVERWRKVHSQIVAELADVERRKYSEPTPAKIRAARERDRRIVTEKLDRWRANDPPHFQQFPQKELSKGDWGDPGPLKVNQILGPRRAICEMSFKGSVVVDGLDFTDTADGQRIAVDWPLIATGTTQLAAANGATRTLFVLSPVPKRPPTE